MATVDVTVTSDLDAAQAWKLASDLDRVGEWLTIFGGWRGHVPDDVREGTRVSSLIKVKGFRNVIHWTVNRYEEPRLLEMTGRGRGGVRIALRISITDARQGSAFHLRAELSGGVLAGPIGRLVARILRAEIGKSARNLTALRQPMSAAVTLRWPTRRR